VKKSTTGRTKRRNPWASHARLYLRRFLGRRVGDVRRDRNGWRLFTEGGIARLKEWATEEKAGELGAE